MRVLGVLCLAAYAVCVLADGYLPGKEYVYKYKGRVYAEMDEQHHQHAGLALKSEVHVQPQDDHLTVKITHVVVDKFNERVTTERGYNFNFKENEVLTHNLQKPFQIYLEHGLVHHIKVSKDDPIWSINLKKSLASLFQLNFKQIHSVHDNKSDKHKEPDLEAHYFKVIEDSLYGECETMYQIGHEPTRHNPHALVLNVTKSTDYGHCSKMPYYLYENVNYDNCVDCYGDLVNADRLSNVLHYNIRGDRNNYVIEKVHIESEFTHAPFTSKGDMGYVHTNRTLLLIEERDVTEAIALEEEVVSHFDLHFHFYGEHGFKDIVDLKEPHFLYHFLGKSAEIEVIGKEFNDLLAPIIDETFAQKFKEHHAPYKFAELVKHIGTLSYDDIEKFYKQFVDLPSENTVEILGRTQLFFEMLSSAGTNPAYLFAKDHLFESHVSPHVAAHFVSMLPFTIKEASETLFDDILKLCENPNIRSNAHVQNVCYLSLSSLIYEHCVGKNYKLHVKLPSTLGEGCTPEVAKKFYDQIVTHFENEHYELEEIAGIKATGNLGLKEGVSYLKKFIEDDHQPTYFRVEAIWSLRRIAKSHPEAVLEEVVPIYFNLSEGHEVRLAAFGIIIVASPHRSLLEAIGVALHEEHNHQVVSFVSSAFYYLANSEYPCHKKIKTDMQHVLRHVWRLDSLPSFDFKHSRWYLNSGYNDDLGYGGMTSVSYVTSNDSYLPHNVYVGANDYFLDRSVESLAIIFNQEGLDKLVDRILGPEGLYKTKKSIFDLFHRRVARDTASVEKELKEIDEALHIKTRHERPIHGDISVRMFGHQVSFFYFNDTTFEEFLHDGYFNVPDIQDVLKKLPSMTFTRFFVQAQAVLVVPTSIGFPMFINYQEPTAVYYKNSEFKFEVSPNVFADLRNNEAPDSVSLHVKGHLIHDTVRRGVMGISMIYDHTTLGVGQIRRNYINKPIDVDFKLDLKAHQFSMKAAKTEDYNLFHVSAQPFTFIDDYSNDVDIAVESGYLPYYKLEEMNDFHESYYHDYLGYGVDVKAKYGKLDIFRNREHARKFIAEHSLRDAYYVLCLNPHFASYEADIDITAAEDDHTEQVELLVDFDYHDIKSNKPLHSDLYDHHEDLEEHARALPGRKFHTYIVKANIDRKGTKERKVEVEATYTHSSDHKLQKYTLYYDRSPHHAEETEHFKVCANAYMRYPDYDMKKLHDLETLDLDQKIDVQAKIGFGNDCKTDRKISVHGSMSRSKEQVELEHKREEVDHLHYNPYSHYYHKCKEEHTRGAYYDYHCRVYIYLATRMDYYDIDVEFETDMTKEFINNTRKFFGELEHDLFYYMDKNYVLDEPHKRLDFHLDFSPLKDTVDIEILRKYATDHFHNVPFDHIYSPFSASPYLTFSNKFKINRVFAPSLCSVEGEYVTTFDNVTYHLPETDCWKVLAKDCSEHEYFLILGKKGTNPNFPKAVKVFLGKVKVEILPVTDTAEPIVRVNGKKVEVSKTARYEHHDPGHENETDFFVVYNGFYYKIISNKYGVTVFYDGKAIVSQISAYYKGKQCGLCGDYNHEHEDEFRGPEDCVYHSATDFAASYAVHEDGCHAPAVSKDPCEH